ncbi:MAG: SH3 domain-containing protein [Syntrophorhabdus aromaticivorans]|uniref:SH3 domain-containing protein n=1 Tax=Syntrophorhabdus aromaticivorans TaxID=328301 RepID=A0A971M2G1_9BACT|nr:SH3 domain-containing protein [Syntrophorhabdus aromaticivorans]
MSEEYIEYWGLTRHPFLLAPDSKMMCVTGQYYECLERLKYAIGTNKGGVLIVSEDAGLGKTTILLRLVDEMREEYGEAFRHAFVHHPALSPAQMIAQITGSIAGVEPHEDKLKNLILLKNVLMEVKEQGGKSIIIVDEAQMLCEAHDVLQELRALINLTHNGEYLHTFILSGQRALWNTVKGLPEFWQRLPVRYYFIPLRVEETKEMIRFRLRKAGIDESREVFADDALEIIHRFSRGSPRTVIALADLSLLVGFTNQSDRITFKEVSKAINTMSGKGDTLPYVQTEKKEGRGPSISSFANIDRGTEIGRGYEKQSLSFNGRESLEQWVMQYGHYARPIITIVVMIAVVLLGIMGYRYVFTPDKAGTVAAEAEKKERAGKPAIENKEPQEEKATEGFGAGETEQPSKEAMDAVEPPRQRVETPFLPEVPVVRKERKSAKNEVAGPAGEAVINKLAANIRTRPDLNSPRFAMLFQGETVKILDETFDDNGKKWYKIPVLGRREGWISETVVTLK